MQQKAARRRLIAASLILLAGLAGPTPSSPQTAMTNTRVPVLSDANLSKWKSWDFSGMTRYSKVTLDGRVAVKAVSKSAASGLYRKLRIDLQATPLLNWSWRVDNTFGPIDERSRGGDDYPARIYVIVKHPLFFWKTTALTYVWSSAQPAGTAWPNAYTDNATIVAVRSGDAELGEWHQERRNVLEDFRRYFGKKVRYIDAVAVMTDTDNTGDRAVAYYGDIWFTAR
ncbi:MAG: DUF3047 domain-containing protein [Gammaproteobacteria bacterium]|nr:DUF3047 domain-containing protein [Gammaproteobacteria bacterium]